MARKSTKKSREQEYQEILEKYGVRFEDCDVLAFAFEQERRPEVFHYSLMLREPRPGYFIFDIFDKFAYVVVPKDEKNAAVIVSIAEQDGGKRITTNLR